MRGPGAAGAADVKRVDKISEKLEEVAGVSAAMAVVQRFKLRRARKAYT